MFKKNIAVTMRYDTFYNKKELRNGIDFNMIKWIYNLGYNPHLIPNDLKKPLVAKIIFLLLIDPFLKLQLIIPLINFQSNNGEFS